MAVERDAAWLRACRPFDELLAPVGELPPQQFTGQARDGEAGLDYFGARFYQPRHGRFTQVDRVYVGLFDPQQWNRYTYARANPLSFVDPDGRCVGTGVWNGHSAWVLSCGSSDTDRVGPGGGNGSGMSAVDWGLYGLASGGWGSGFGYTDPGRGAGGGRSGGGPGSRPPTPQDGTGATTPDPDTAVACSGAECGPLVPNPLTDVLGQAAPVSQALGVGAVARLAGAANLPILAAIRLPFVAAGIRATFAASTTRDSGRPLGKAAS